MCKQPYLIHYNRDRLIDSFLYHSTITTSHHNFNPNENDYVDYYDDFDDDIDPIFPLSMLQTTTSAAAVAVGANENESTSLVCDSNSINNNEAEEEEEEEEENPSSSLIKMRWQQLAREAFNYSLNQRLKMQNGSNAKNKSKKTQEILLNDNMIFKQNIIDLIALNTSVNDDILPCKRYNNWVQLSGHEDSFALAGPGTIWKKHSPDSTEVDVYEALMNEPIAEMMPKFYRNVQYKGDNFIELEDLLYNFKDASIMDIKMGTRTFLESEVINTKARNDLYEKMIRIDPTKLTESEHHAKAVTKLRYMKLRENLSSSSNLGFRIEGFKVIKSKTSDHSFINLIPYLIYFS